MRIARSFTYLQNTSRWSGKTGRYIQRLYSPQPGPGVGVGSSFILVRQPSCPVWWFLHHVPSNNPMRFLGFHVPEPVGSLVGFPARGALEVKMSSRGPGADSTLLSPISKHQNTDGQLRD